MPCQIRNIMYDYIRQRSIGNDTFTIKEDEDNINKDNEIHHTDDTRS